MCVYFYSVMFWGKCHIRVFIIKFLFLHNAAVPIINSFIKGDNFLFFFFFLNLRSVYPEQLSLTSLNLPCIKAFKKSLLCILSFLSTYLKMCEYTHTHVHAYFNQFLLQSCSLVPDRTGKRPMEKIVASKQ